MFVGTKKQTFLKKVLLLVHDGLYVVFYQSRGVINGSVEHTPLHVDGVAGVLAPPLGRKAPLRSEPGRSTEPWLHLRHIRAHGTNSDSS